VFYDDTLQTSSSFTNDAIIAMTEVPWQCVMGIARNNSFNS